MNLNFELKKAVVRFGYIEKKIENLHLMFKLKTNRKKKLKQKNVRL